MKWSRIVLLLFALCCVQSVAADSLFNIWSQLLPGGVKRSVVVDSNVSSAVPRNVTRAETSTRLTSLLNPINWFQSTRQRQPVANQFLVDAELDTAEIITRNGYPAETHTVVTEDGYLIKLHRIPCGRSGWTSCRGQGRGRGQAVFIQHGLLGSSADWVITGPENSLAFLLADLGYDCWLGNVRGNTYSRHHVNMSNKEDKFWDFSWHEMAMNDIPAAIDHIIQVKRTEVPLFGRRLRQAAPQVIYIGHSMGTTMAFAMLAKKPEYNAKVKAVFALAPVASMRHVKSPIRILAPYSRNIEWILQVIGNKEFLPQNQIIKFLAKYGCELTDAERYICENSIFVLCGFDKEQYNEKLAPVIFAHAPAGTSIKTIVHYAQEIHEDGQFQQFDYGRNGNEIRYGQAKPPLYPVENITVPVQLIYASNDWLAGQQDVEWMHGHLPNSMGVRKVPFEKFNHLDFMWGIDAKALVYDDLIKQIDTISQY